MAGSLDAATMAGGMRTCTPFRISLVPKGFIFWGSVISHLASPGDLFTSGERTTTRHIQSMKTNTSSWSTLRLPKPGTVAFVVAPIIVECWDLTDAIIFNRSYAHAQSIAATDTGKKPTHRRPVFSIMRKWESSQEDGIGGRVINIISQQSCGVP